MRFTEENVPSACLWLSVPVRQTAAPIAVFSAPIADLLGSQTATAFRACDDKAHASPPFRWISSRAAMTSGMYFR